MVVPPSTLVAPRRSWKRRALPRAVDAFRMATTLPIVGEGEKSKEDIESEPYAFELWDVLMEAGADSKKAKAVAELNPLQLEACKAITLKQWSQSPPRAR